MFEGSSPATPRACASVQQHRTAISPSRASAVDGGELGLRHCARRYRRGRRSDVARHCRPADVLRRRGGVHVVVSREDAGAPLARQDPILRVIPDRKGKKPVRPASPGIVPRVPPAKLRCARRGDLLDGRDECESCGRSSRCAHRAAPVDRRSARSGCPAGAPHATRDRGTPRLEPGADRDRVRIARRRITP